MADFKKSVNYLLENEGGLSNHPDDPGGVTNFGVTLTVLREMGEASGDVDQDGDIDSMDVRHLTREDAKQVYRQLWWDRYRYDRLVNQNVANKVLDASVNFGPYQAHKVLQRALRAVGVETIVVDGIFGPITVAETNKSDAPSLIAAFRSEMAGVYRLILRARPELGAFREGWFNRAYR